MLNSVEQSEISVDMEAKTRIQMIAEVMNKLREVATAPVDVSGLQVIYIFSSTFG